MTLRLSIVGAGIGGLTAALCLRARGFDVTVYEQAPEITEVGAGLQISPNASRILIDLGLNHALREISFEPKALELRRGETGKLVFSIPMGKRALERYGSPYYHLHRADLVAVLINAIKQIDGIEIKTNTAITGYQEHPAFVSVLDDQGQQIDRADVLIGADGVKSTIRHVLHGYDPARFTGNVAWRAVVNATPQLKKIIPEVASVWTGNKRHAVTYYIRGGELINFVGVTETSNWTDESWSQPGDLSELAEAFSGFAKPIRQLIDEVDSCFKWALHTRPPLPFWSRGRVTLLGDAAHPMLPFQAQGAAQAIEDAAVMARMLSTTSLNNIPEGLKRYEEARLPRASKIQAASRSNMTTFHRGSGLAGTLTYGPMALAARTMPDFVTSRQDWIYAYVA